MDVRCCVAVSLLLILSVRVSVCVSLARSGCLYVCLSVCLSLSVGLRVKEPFMWPSAYTISRTLIKLLVCG